MSEYNNQRGNWMTGDKTRFISTISFSINSSLAG